MRTTALTSTAAALGCAVLLLVAGCSSDSSPDGSSSEGTDKTAEMGPLSAYFERIAGDQDEEDWNKLAQASEEIVASCMREQGFEYTPQDTSQTAVKIESDDDGPEYGTEEYAAEFGYGMTTSMGSDASDSAESADEWVDPNADYLATMSETEQAAFYEALYGPTVEYDENADPEDMPEYNWETSGCQGKAQHETYDTGVNAAYSDPAFTSLQEEMNKVWDTVTTDPAMAAIDAEWSSCMADANYDFATQQDAVNSISDQQNELYTAASEGMEEGATAAPEPDPAAVEALRKLEIDTAVADAKCKKSTDYDARAQKVQFAAEQAFVDAHKAELDAWADKYSQASS